MLARRITARSSRTLLSHSRGALPLLARREPPPPSRAVLSSKYRSLVESRCKVVPVQVSLLNDSFLNRSLFQQFGFSSSATPRENEKETTKSGVENGSASESGDAPKRCEETEASDAANVQNEKDDADSESKDDLSRDDLMKLVSDKEEELKNKTEELQKVQDRALRACAEMQNMMDRTKRDAENMKKFAVQDFAKSLLDVADNLGRASLAVKDKFLKIDESKDDVGAVPLLKTFLQGVEMTEKQLAEVFKKFGVQKYDPTGEEFDPHRHNAVFQIPDASKPPGTVSVVLKAGYMLHDRIIRPAEVGVTQAVENDAEGSET